MSSRKIALGIVQLNSIISWKLFQGTWLTLF